MKILFIADKFDDELRDDVCSFPGGAELTDAAIIEACPWEIEKIKIENLELDDLKKFDYFIIGNLRNGTKKQIRAISKSGRHILFEHDMRICRYGGDFLRARKEPVHYYIKRCICPHFIQRRLYKSSLGIIFLSHHQLGRYKKNPFFSAKRIGILGSSAMNNDFFKKVKTCDQEKKKDNTLVFYSPYRSKGYKKSIAYCKQEGINPIEINNKKPDEVLDMFKKSKRFVFLPEIPEAAGRMPIEARFLGCEVVLNNNVGVAEESWWNLEDDLALEVLKDTPDRFWRIVKNFIK